LGVLLTQALAGIRCHAHHDVPGHHSASHVHLHDLIPGESDQDHNARPHDDDVVDLPSGDQKIERPIVLKASTPEAIAILRISDMAMSSDARQVATVRLMTGSFPRPVLRI
jgi:hypothetical protein